MKRLLALALATFALLPAFGQDRPVVVIDPGHGGDETGVQVGDMVEKDLVLEIGFVIAAEFAKAGYDVVFTRTTDKAVSWPDRRSIAEEAGASFLLMLHANGSEDATENGAEVYASLDDAHSAEFSGMVAEKLTTVGASVLEGRPWPFLKSPSVATAMIEIAFMTNPDDAGKLADAAFQRAVGAAMVEAAEATRASH